MKQLTQKELKKFRANLRTWYERKTDAELIEGLNWYNDAQKTAAILADVFKVERSVAAAVISALSPNNKWERNKLDAATVLSAVESGTPMESVKVCTYSSNKAKAFAIAKGETKISKTSPKTFAFAKTVGDLDERHVTIDKWHLRACQTASKSPVKVSESCSSKQYKQIESETAKVAAEYGIPAYKFQAVIWVVIRNRWSN